MKLCIYLILLVLGITNGQKPRRDETYPPPDLLARFKIIHDVCQEKTGATEEAIKEFSDGEIHEDAALKCYMNCIFHEINVVDDDGEMHFEKLRRAVPDNLVDIVEPMLAACSHPEGETQCDRAFWFHQCWKKTDPVWQLKLLLVMGKPVINSCMKQSTVTEEAKQKFRSGENVEDKSLKCYMNCLLTEFHATNDNGDVNWKVIYDKAPRSVRQIVINMSKDCVKPQGDTRCEKAYWYHVCWRKADSEHYYLP